MITTTVNTGKNQVAFKYSRYVLFYIYIILFFSIVFCLRAVSSIAIGCILLAGITGGIAMLHVTSNKSGFTLFILACSLLFLLQCLSLLHTTNRIQGWKLLERSSGLLFIPLGLFLSQQFLSTVTFRTLVGYFVLILSGGCLYCLLIATIKYFSGAPLQVLFYHDLVAPSLHHAIQYSLLVFIALVWLIENPKEQIGLLPYSFSRYLVPFLSIFLVLLSSKLIITVFILYLLYFFFHQQVNKARLFALSLAITGATLLLISTNNPVGNRFRTVFSGNMLLFKQPSFSPGIYFNGAQFRLLQWRFTYEILNEQKAWVLGLTPGDAQSFLDKKYIETNMYTGIPGTEKHGFLGYHTHNQFLQSLLENGLLGLVIFIMICCSMVIMAKQCKTKELNWMVGLFIFYCFTDAPFQTQYGILIFILFPCLIFLTTQNTMRHKVFSPKEHLAPIQVQKQPN